MVDIAGAFALPGKVAIVTGGAAGIGEATAAVLAAAGARVVVSDWDGDGAARVATAIAAEGGDAVARGVDVSDAAAVTALVEEVVAEFGGLDILVNNAGIMARRPVLEISPEEFDRILSVNLKGVFYGCQAAGRVMGRGGRIVNMLSEIIDRGTAETGSYAAAKKGAEALTRTFAVELGQLGIRVNGVAPAWTITAMTRQRGLNKDGEFEPGRFDEVKEKLAALSPLGVVNDPIDIAYAVLYLVSEAGRNINGQVLRVNSGSSMT
ncbi:SDR family oxidoreductase [Nonomuraea sp. NPDC005650]|uniref:SDR family NAD(P)-dependent oxidoreductase n=1 Tax=Nonomuraea sp. NPDC005650 TaxID=3157045 RepID=UPI0033BE9359